MKNYTYLSLIISVILLFSFDGIAKPNQKEKRIKSVQQTEVEKHLGRKLKWTERISLKLLNKRLVKKVAKQGTQVFDGFAIAGLVTGIAAILSFIFSGFVISAIFGVLAIVLGAIGMKRTRGLKDFRKKGRGLAVAGLVIGIVVTAFWGLLLIAFANWSAS